jgi:uncharacterized protein (DUF4415 family)
MKKLKSKKLPPLIDEEGEVREITAEDFKLFRPAREVMSPRIFAMFEAHQRERERARGERGPGKRPARVQMSIRLDPDIAAMLKTIPNWRREANNLLRTWLDQQTAK